ncbi:hypothetical protein [Vibrio owensii]|uniref:hypothetical protein n=1 Tax=Vibrio owensii TaxID=696485 RepID=UPI003DA0BBBF
MQIDGLAEFLKQNPLMKVVPIGSDGQLALRGKVKLCHQYQQYPKVTSLIELKITFPNQYPFRAAVFEEVGGTIPKSDDYHINPDGSFCLGSPYRVESFVRGNKNFNVFYDTFCIPYLYAVLLKIQHGIDFVFGELKHGNEGELEDWSAILNLTQKEQVLKCLEAMSLKKRLSNKQACPCDCGKRLGVCSLHNTLNKHRKQMPRSWFKRTSIKLRK